MRVRWPPSETVTEERAEALAGALAKALEGALDDLLRLSGLRRLVLLARSDDQAVGTGAGVPQQDIDRLVAAWRPPPERRTEAPAPCRDGALLTAAASWARSPVVVSPGAHRDLEMAAVLDVPADDPRVRRVDDALTGARRYLAQVVELHEVRGRARTLEKRLRRARSALEALPDPVLVMDADARIRLANRRAEELFVIGPGDSPGRRHALETNNLYFSAFRARARLETADDGSRELVLVDPTDGSDLLFEVSVQAFQDLDGPADGSIFVLRNITDLKLATHELEIQVGRAIAAQHREHRESERLNVIIENAGVPILVTDPHAHLILMNREAARLLSVGSDAEPRSLPHGVPANDAKLAGFINEFLLQPESRREGRITLVDLHEQRELPCLVVSTKILNEHSEPTAVVTLLHDLTQEVENQRLAQELRTLNAQLEGRVREATRELAERNAQLERQSAELERASKLKSEFLATMSHELRTPINAVMGYSSLLRDGLFGRLTDPQLDALQRMRNAAEHLLTLINDILDLSRVEAGQIQVSPTTVDLAECLETLSESVRPMAVQKSLRYVLEVDETVPAIRTDVTRLRQVLLNLLSNAVKFTPEGSITLRAFPLDGRQRVRIEVIDTGIGIAERDLESIFDEFTQADQSITREHGGTGLGLTISRKLIEVMGGDLGVESELGRGSMFYVELPVLPPVSWGDGGRSGITAEIATAPLG
ncbi:MAG TPA: ATP-binding protein [Longimicrobiales bacterium]|nr:ATP-binding protein [Longimicrobiales bacterium]